jgi:hypothetical protein
MVRGAHASGESGYVKSILLVKTDERVLALARQRAFTGGQG